MKKYVVYVAAVAAIMCSTSLFNLQKSSDFSETVLANVEALASLEYDAPCIEWVDKNCWNPDEFSDVHGTDYHATCSGEPSTSGGKLECGAISSHLPLSPYQPKECLQCVATANGTI